jgi:hypothetical protein
MLAEQMRILPLETLTRGQSILHPLQPLLRLRLTMLTPPLRPHRPPTVAVSLRRPATHPPTAPPPTIDPLTAPELLYGRRQESPNPLTLNPNLDRWVPPPPSAIIHRPGRPCTAHTRPGFTTTSVSDIPPPPPRIQF